MQKKINILHITHDLNYGGLQKLLVDLCTHTDRASFNLSVLSLRELGPLTQQIKSLGITVDLLPQKNGTDYWSFLSIARYLKGKKIDIIHTHNSQPFMEGTIASLLSGGHKIIHTDHGRIFPDKKRYMLMERFVSHFADRIIAVSEKTAQDLNKYLKINSEKMKVIENGADGLKFDVTLDKSKFKQELDLATNDFILGFIGRLVFEKGLEYLLRALAELVLDMPQLKLIIVGDGQKKEMLEELSRKLNLNHHIRFVGLRSDTHLFYKIFDLFVLPSVSEGLPLVLLESMAAKCPVLATRVGGIPSVIDHNKSGYLIHPKNTQSISDALKYLIQNPVQRNNYAECAFRFFKQNYDISVMIKQYEEEYRKLLS